MECQWTINQPLTMHQRSYRHWLQNYLKTESQAALEDLHDGSQKSEMILSMWVAIVAIAGGHCRWVSRWGLEVRLCLQLCSSTPAITCNYSLPGSPFTFEQAPGSAPGTGGPHFWTWTCFFHQEPDHSFDLQLLHELDLDLGGEPRDLCPSDVEGDSDQADHQTVSSWVLRTE